MKIEVAVPIVEVNGTETTIQAPHLYVTNHWNRKELVVITNQPADVRTFTVSCDDLRRALSAVQAAKP